MGECIEKIATKYIRTKFLKIISNDCIPGYPDRNLPTILVYKDTECKHNLVGKLPYGGRLSPESKLLILALACQDEPPEATSDPRVPLSTLYGLIIARLAFLPDAWLGTTAAY